MVAAVDIALNGHGPSMPSRFVPNVDTIRVTFPEDSEWHGAVVRCRRYASVEFMLQLERAISAKGGENSDDDPMIYQTIRRFVETTLIGWNLRMPRLADPPDTYDEDGIPVPNYELDDDGEQVTDPVPPTLEGVSRLPQAFVVDLLIAYQTARTGISPKLSTQPLNGEQSEEPSETTEVSSKSPKTSRKPTS